MPITPVVHRLELLSQLNLLFPIYVLLIGDIYSMLFFFWERGVVCSGSVFRVPAVAMYNVRPVLYGRYLTFLCSLL